MAIAYSERNVARSLKTSISSNSKVTYLRISTSYIIPRVTGAVIYDRMLLTNAVCDACVVYGGVDQAATRNQVLGLDPILGTLNLNVTFTNTHDVLHKTILHPSLWFLCPSEIAPSPL